MTTDVSTILSRKLRHMFDMLDADRDGRLTAEDMTGLADALAVPFAARPEKVQALREALRHIWDAHLRRMDTDGDGGLAPAEYERGVRLAIAEDSAALIEALNDTVVAWFALFDEDGDGLLGIDEYVKVGQAIGGIPAPDMRRAFERLDHDADGGLRQEEIRAAAVEYFTSEDPDADGNWLYGPL